MQDYGGSIGFRMAMTNPYRISAIIIQNTNTYEEGLEQKQAKLALYGRIHRPLRTSWRRLSPGKSPGSAPGNTP
jgi:pimeloyl-ACP methyl ester carboxylesterase